MQLGTTRATVLLTAAAIGLSAQEIVQQGTFRVDQNLRSLSLSFRAVTLPDLIARRGGERSFRTNLFDPTRPRWQPTEVHITRVDATGVQAQVGDLGRYHIDRAGQVREINGPRLGIRAFLTDSKDAQNIT